MPINHSFTSTLKIELSFPQPIEVRLRNAEIPPAQYDGLVKQIVDELSTRLAGQLGTLQGDLTKMKASIQDLISSTVADEAVASKISDGITALEAKIDDVNAKLLAADDEADIKALSDEHAKLSAQLAKALATVTPASTEVPTEAAAAV